MNVRLGGFMLRRYLIVNGLSSLVLYAAIWAYVPSLASLTRSFNTSFESYVMGHTFLAPVLHRMITIL